MTTITLAVVACSSQKNAAPSSTESAGGAAGSSQGGSSSTAGASGAGASGSPSAAGSSIAGSEGVAGAAGDASDAGASGSVGENAAGNGGAAGSTIVSPCPATEPLMNDPCSDEGRECDYPGGAGCILVAKCTSARWGSYVAMIPTQTCNPPNPCPSDEPSLGDVCDINDGLDPPPSNCRYPHGACFTYWTCSNDAATAFASSTDPHADGCCPMVAPTVGGSCSVVGITCTYEGAAFSCDGTSWSSG